MLEQQFSDANHVLLVRPGQFSSTRIGVQTVTLPIAIGKCRRIADRPLIAMACSPTGLIDTVIANCQNKSDRQVAPIALLSRNGVWFLEIQLQSKLKLTWVIRGGREAVIPAVTSPLIERVDVAKQWRRRSFIEPIEKVEAFGN